jgi:hypothetical protein
VFLLPLQEKVRMRGNVIFTLTSILPSRERRFLTRYQQVAILSDEVDSLSVQFRGSSKPET